MTRPTPQAVPSPGPDVAPGREPGGPPLGRLARLRTSLVRGRAGTVLLAALTAVAVAAAGWAVFTGVTALRASAAADEAGAAAGGLVTRLLSYDAATIEADATAARAVATGPFRDEYSRLLTDRIIPAAREQQAHSTAEATRHAVVASSPNQVVVLVFLNQTTTGNHLPAPRVDAGSARVTLDRTDDGWQVSGMEAT